MSYEASGSSYSGARICLLFAFSMLPGVLHGLVTMTFCLVESIELDGVVEMERFFRLSSGGKAAEVYNRKEFHENMGSVCILQVTVTC